MTQPTPTPAPPGVPATNPVRLTLRVPLYRAITVALFIGALGMSAAAPQIASFLVNELGADLQTAGLYYLTSLTAPIAGFIVGSWSDRTGRRMGLFRLAALLGFAGWAGIAFSTELWMPFVISAIILGFAGAATSQLFAALHDEMVARPDASNDGVVAIVRMALTGGWVVGPVAGTYLASVVGLREMLFATAVCMLAQIVPMGWLRPAPPVRTERTKDVGVGVRAMLPLLVFTGLYICVYAGESVKYAYLPIYMRDELHLAPALSGAIIGVQPLVELALIPVAVYVARRVGMLRLMVFAAAAGIGANLAFALLGDVFGLFLGQILMGVVWGVFAALGIIVAQRLLPQAVATASAIFMSSMALSQALGGLAGGLGAATLGLPAVFIVPAAFAVVATIGFWIMRRRAGEP